MLNLDVPEPGAGITAGFSVSDTPAGSPEAFNCRDSSNPLLTLVVTVPEPDFPCCTVTVAGDTLTLKGAVVGGSTNKLAPAIDPPYCARTMIDSAAVTAKVETGKLRLV